MIVSIYKNIRSVNTGFNRSIFFILDRIKNGNSRKLIEQIRNESIKEKRDKLKEQLPSICFSGTFKRREDSALLKHSGLICLDFDGLPNNKEFEKLKTKILTDKYTFASFLSPSGNGLKAIIKIPAEPELHRKYFNSLEKHFNSKYFDKSCINVSRSNYESWDENLYLNENSDLFINYEDFEPENIGAINPIIPLKSQNIIIQNLMKWFNKNYSFTKGTRNTNFFILAAAFNDFGIPKNDADHILSDFHSADFTKKEITTIIESAYKNAHFFNTKKFEDEALKEKLQVKIRAGDSEKNIKKELSEFTSNEAGDIISNLKANITITQFWYYNENGDVKVINHKFKQFLEQNGFFKYYPPGSENFIFIKIKENIIADTSPMMIKDFVLNYLYNSDFGFKPYDYFASRTALFKEDYLSFIDTSNIKIKEDNKDFCYLYYKNTVLEISSHDIKQIDYIDFQGFIWEKYIIDRNWTKLDSEECDFKKFIHLVCGKDDKKFFSMLSVIGYLCNSFKTSANNKAIIFNDETIAENPNGGSGKGIICNAISKIKRVVILDGKQFNFEKSFPYQTVSADTQVLVFDDVKKNFQFESLFSLVTEGITLEKKNKDAIKKQVEYSPKIVITTNYTIKGSGGSFDRRKFEVELSAFFNENYTPFDEFKRMLFDDWDEPEWQRFDNFMVLCCQYFLKNGLQEFSFHNLKIRKFIAATSFEFYEWINEEAPPINERIDKTIYYNNFIEEYPDLTKWMSQKLFSKWIQHYAIFKNYSFAKIKSNGIRYIILNENSEPKTDTLPF